jgi:aerobic-type carbon monoxide dehydrogenase small subunit (CoxS/CutS family)
MNITLTINDQRKSIEITPGEKLLDTLRSQGYKSVKFGCGEGTCGSCLVLVGGEPRLACITFTAQVAGKTITTLEGLGTFEKLHPLQESFLAEGAVQCGYCTPGMILAAKALLDKNPVPSEEDIKNALDGNRCRCTGYTAIIRAIKRAAELMKSRQNNFSTK